MKVAQLNNGSVRGEKVRHKTATLILDSFLSRTGN